MCIVCLLSLYPMYLIMDDKHQRRKARKAIVQIKLIDVFNQSEMKEAEDHITLIRAAEMILARPQNPDNWCELQKAFERNKHYIQDETATIY